MTTFHVEKYGHLVSAHKASAQCIPVCSSVRQFLIHGTFVLVNEFSGKQTLKYKKTRHDDDTDVDPGLFLRVHLLFAYSISAIYRHSV